MSVVVRNVGSRDDDGVLVNEVTRLRELVETLAERNRQLEHALESRIVIEQAKGVLAERLGVEPDDAFERLRRAARRNRITVRDLAHAVVTSRNTPDAFFSPPPRAKA